MTHTRTAQSLLQLFGNKIGPIPESVLYSIDVETPLDNTELKNLLEEQLGLKNIAIGERSRNGVNVTLPYAIVRKKQQDGHSDGNGILNQILALRPPISTRIHIPIPESLQADAESLASDLSQAFDFMPGASIANQHLMVTPPQFTTLRSEWDKHAEVDDRAAASAGFLDMCRADDHNQAHGTAQSLENRSFKDVAEKLFGEDSAGIDLFADDKNQAQDGDKGTQEDTGTPTPQIEPPEEKPDPLKDADLTNVVRLTFGGRK